MCGEIVKLRNLALPSPLKAEFILIDRGQNIIRINNPIPIRADGKVIEGSKSTKYLGILIDENLTWDQHINYISNKIK